jgi:hypothetical protein
MFDRARQARFQVEDLREVAVVCTRPSTARQGSTSTGVPNRGTKRPWPQSLIVGLLVSLFLSLRNALGRVYFVNAFLAYVVLEWGAPENTVTCRDVLGVFIAFSTSRH